jgi:peptidoglycan/LPS O-acetylase OafA/YrhL
MFIVLAEASFRFVERPLRAKFARKSAGPGPPIFGPLGARVPRVT